MKIALFSPNALINVHAIPEALVGEALQQNGHEIIQIGCDGLLNKYCVSMSAMGIWADDPVDKKNAACVFCKRSRLEIKNRFHFTNILIDNFAQDNDADFIAGALSNVDKNNWMRFEYEDIPVGRYAAYEFLLNYKLNKVSFSDVEWRNFFPQLENALKTLVCGRRLLNYIQPDRLTTYNSLYSVNHIMCSIADQMDIPHYTLHAGSHHVYRLSQMTIFKGLNASALLNKSRSWNKFVKIPLSQELINKADLHIKQLLEATSPWVYSVKSQNLKSEELLKFFDVKKGQKVLLATMASADERFAADLIDAMPPYKEPFFKSQINWLEHLIHWANTEKEVIIIIRVHPREFPNKREGVLSAQAIALQETFSEIPSNVKINWPSDNISLHDLVKIVDVGLNATSTAGLELLIFGLPVVIYDTAQLFSYPRELNVCSRSKESYIDDVNTAIRRGWSFDNIYNVYSWIAYRSEVVSIDISDGFVNDYIISNDAPDPALRGLLTFQHEPLVNRKWLTYAIESGNESHLDAFVASLPTTTDLSYTAGFEIIKKKTILLLNKLAAGDDLFHQKISKLVDDSD